MDRVATHGAAAKEDNTSLMKLFAAGLNAHGQLDAENTGDARAFTSIPTEPEDESVDVLFAGWSTTVLTSQAGRIWSLGHQKLGEHSFNNGTKDSRASVCGAFGDHNGLVGFLSSGDGGLTCTTEQTASEDNSRLVTLTTEASPSISQIALAGTERIAVTFKQAPNGRLCHIAEFPNLEKFLSWYQDPSGADNYPQAHYMLPGRPKQLIANTATFLLLMEGGEVYSWGDGRHQSLGRSISGEGAVIGEKPGVVEALGGLRIAKVASGGWMSAALSEDGAMYLWGAGTHPGAEKSVRCLREAGVGEVALVDLPEGVEEGEPLDVVDIAVGDAHVAAITADGHLFVVGDNTNGQLGLDSEEAFFEEWMRVEAIWDVRRVVCGPKATFASLGEGYKVAHPGRARPTPPGQQRISE